MKIITGKYKNRAVPTVKSSDYRPSTGKLKEAIFSILSSGEFAIDQPLIGTHVLDLFSGTGALAFESLSRGAKFATLVDINPEHLKMAENFAQKIGARNDAEFICTRASLIGPAKRQYDLVFIDPPYFKKLLLPAVSALVKNNYLKPETIVVIEVEKEYRESELGDYLSIVKDKAYGNTRLIIAKSLA